MFVVTLSSIVHTVISISHLVSICPKCYKKMPFQVLMMPIPKTQYHFKLLKILIMSWLWQLQINQLEVKYILKIMRRSLQELGTFKHERDKKKSITFQFNFNGCMLQCNGYHKCGGLR